MNIRQAILEAADQIEQHPETYRFRSNENPKCGTPGCLLGWIGCKAGVVQGSHPIWLFAVMEKLGYGRGVTIMPFLDEMAELRGHPGAWQENAQAAADKLRAYADKRFPGIPQEVLKIFTPPLATPQTNDYARTSPTKEIAE